ncbi:hypothetical protein C2E23DRAFT_935780 [Lenzites betulinus]|nr:hypothetical protein C2E23DRAFT_935780 [Lenzites betulinus]
MLLLAALAPLALVAAAVDVSRAAAADPVPGGERRIRRLESLAKQCKFTLGNQRFDLCPVLDGNDGGWSFKSERKTPPTVTTSSYRISLQGPLKKDENAPQHEQCMWLGPTPPPPGNATELTGVPPQCPPGTWICQIITNRRPAHPDEEERVLQTVPIAGAMELKNITKYYPGVNITAQLAPSRPHMLADAPGMLPGMLTAQHADVLHVRLHGGYYVYGPQKADLQFICDHGVDEPSAPSYGWYWNGTHTFNWRTKHACGTRLPPPAGTVTATRPGGPAPTSDPTTEPPEDTPPSDDEELPDKELADGRPFGGRTTRSMMVLLLSSFTAVLALAYVAWFPPPRVRQAVSRFVKAHPRLARWRVGERVLMRWAYEDLEMDDGYGYGEGEEDVMVNFAAMPEEGIPLKPSPRLGGVSGYGAA